MREFQNISKYLRFVKKNFETQIFNVLRHLIFNIDKMLFVDILMLHNMKLDVN